MSINIYIYIYNIEYDYKKLSDDHADDRNLDLE